MAVLKEAEDQLNQMLFKGWHRLKTNPDSVKAERRGVENMRLRTERILTGGV
jgi:hypothetical protein